MGGTISHHLVAQKSDLSESCRQLFPANDQLQVCAPWTLVPENIKILFVAVWGRSYRFYGLGGQI